MTPRPVVVSLPIADRRTSYEFYSKAFGFVPIGEPAKDGVPEPLQFEVSEGLRLMLVPSDGFGWVIGGNAVASPDTSECVLGIEAASGAEVDELVQRAMAVGARLVSEPAQEAWGYSGAFSDPDGHVWMVVAA